MLFVIFSGSPIFVHYISNFATFLSAWIVKRQSLSDCDKVLRHKSIWVCRQILHRIRKRRIPACLEQRALRVSSSVHWFLLRHIDVTPQWQNKRSGGRVQKICKSPKREARKIVELFFLELCLVHTPVSKVFCNSFFVGIAKFWITLALPALLTK